MFGGVRAMKEPTSRSDWRIVHGIAFVLFMACTMCVPALRRWPWIWLAPLDAYLLLVA
jgi:hypothetical protein